MADSEKPKRWAWSLHPLKPRAWETRQVDDVSTPAGQTVVVRKACGGGSATYLNTGESHPAGSLTLRQTFYLPIRADLKRVQRWFPADDPYQPPWARIEAELIAAGQELARLKQLNAPALLLLLDKAKGGSAANVDKRQADANATKEQPWDDDAPEYMFLSEARKLIDDKLSLQTLGRLCKPDGEIRYMRKGQRCQVHVADFRRYMQSRQSDPEWAAAYMDWRHATKVGKKRMFWKCKNAACGHEYPDDANATDRCPKCESESKLLLKAPPKPRR